LRLCCERIVKDAVAALKDFVADAIVDVCYVDVGALLVDKSYVVYNLGFLLARFRWPLVPRVFLRFPLV